MVDQIRWLLLNLLQGGSEEQVHNFEIRFVAWFPESHRLGREISDHDVLLVEVAQDRDQLG